MQLSAAKVAIILAFISAQAGALPAPSPYDGSVGQGSHAHGGWQGAQGGGMAHGHGSGHGGPGGNGGGSHFGGMSGQGGNRGNHGPSPDEEFDEVLESRDSEDKFRGHHGKNPAYPAHFRNGQRLHQKGEHGPMPDEGEVEGDEDSHLERRHNYVTQPMANWKWWQKQGTKAGIRIKAGNPNVYPIDMKDDPIMDRLGWKRDAEDDEEVEEDEAQMEKRGWIHPTRPQQVDLTFHGGFRDHKTPKKGN